MIRNVGLDRQSGHVRYRRGLNINDALAFGVKTAQERREGAAKRVGLGAFHNHSRRVILPLRESLIESVKTHPAISFPPTFAEYFCHPPTTFSPDK